MKTKLLTIFAVSSLFIGMSAIAQVNDNSTTTTGNVSGNASGAPAALDIDFETLVKWILRRANTVNVDALANDMQTKGIKNAKIGFSAEGALVYHYELNGEKIDQWDDVGRNAGAQILPYTLQVMGNTRKLSVSAFAMRNMTTLQNTDHKMSGKASALWSVMDRLDVINISWDHNTSFNNLNTFDVTAINTGLHFGLNRNDERHPSYIALRAAGSAGLGSTQINDANQYGYDSSKQMGIRAEYSGGLEINLQARSNVRLNLQSNYVGGYAEMKMNNISQEESQSFVRKSAYLKNSADLSLPLRISRRPMRLGVGANVNLVLFDQMSNQSSSVGTAASKIDLSGNYNQKFRGRLYLNF